MIIIYLLIIYYLVIVFCKLLFDEQKYSNNDLTNLIVNFLWPIKIDIK